jgi:uncharacterized protein YbaR (Trm112 family)
MPYYFETMVSQELLEMLVCPACKKPLTYRTQPESLKCEACRRVYPVQDDIPVMLIDRATIDPA